MATKETSVIDISVKDTFKILVATDCHLGYEESKKRGNQTEDSFTTFEEILQYGKLNQVDFVLLGGDLFHDTKPSQSAMIKCTELLRKYCLGPRAVEVEFLTDPEMIFQHCAFKSVNYEDPNINVCMPVFSVHGNHDDPSSGNVGVMDLLSASGLINYFGKWTDLEAINIPPLILRKGESQIAIYGLSHVNDRRLCRLLKDGKVRLLRTEASKNCFNILVLHQNRVKHDAQSYIPEHKLPNFLNLIIWGHEHECRIKPEFIQEGDYFVSQPGSSIATSLCEAEAVKKYVGLLSINKTRFAMKKLRLKTVRPFIFDNLILNECDDIPRDSSKPLKDVIFEYVDRYIEHKLLAEATKLLTGHPKQSVHPLIRLRVFFSNEQEIFDESRLAQKYCDDVCNPTDMIIFRKKRPDGSRSRSKATASSVKNDDKEMLEVFGRTDTQDDWNQSVQDGLKKFFDSDDQKDCLLIFLPSEINEALTRFVEKGDAEAFKDLARYRLKQTTQYLQKENVKPTLESIQEAILKLRDARCATEEKEQEDVHKMFEDASRKKKGSVVGEKDHANDEVIVLDDQSDEEVERRKIAGRGNKGGSKYTKRREEASSRGRSAAGNVSKVAIRRNLCDQKKVCSKAALTVGRAVLLRGRERAGTSGTSSHTRQGPILNQSKASTCTFLNDSDSD